MSKRRRVVGTYQGPLEVERMGKRIVNSRVRSPGCLPMDLVSKRMTDYRRERESR